MIYFLTTKHHSYTINGLLLGFGSKLISRIKPCTYEQLFSAKSLPTGTYIFADIERLTVEQAEMAAKVWNQLARAGKGVRLLNHPTLSMRRYELLRTLYTKGLNQFNVYRLTELVTPQRFPVFIRGENDHQGNQTPLLKSSTELQDALSQLNSQGQSRDSRIIVEFSDTSDEEGVFRKYSAFMIGDRVIPRSVFFGQHWMLKSHKNSVSNQQTLQEEKDYLETNPHQSEIREIFRLANIQYGRIDYSLLNGAIQVWEINTNPAGLQANIADRVDHVAGLPINIFFENQFEEAFRSVDFDSRSPDRLELSLSPPPSGKERVVQILANLILQRLPYPVQVNLVTKIQKKYLGKYLRANLSN